MKNKIIEDLFNLGKSTQEIKEIAKQDGIILEDSDFQEFEKTLNSPDHAEPVAQISQNWDYSKPEFLALAVELGYNFNESDYENFFDSSTNRGKTSKIESLIFVHDFVYENEKNGKTENDFLALLFEAKKQGIKLNINDLSPDFSAYEWSEFLKDNARKDFLELRLDKTYENLLNNSPANPSLQYLGLIQKSHKILKKHPKTPQKLAKKESIRNVQFMYERLINNCLENPDTKNLSKLAKVQSILLLEASKK